ncbi:acyl-CoA dehydrogenase [Oceanobacillus caeni]|uniref:acyl-CoA dehydrogenase n=1 Tax=Oceanobacillus caeni TaxID=405946 RepID=UPI000621A774|nr:acyl-CoA dehydrogenase [Oceanobacillus caeni]KKE77764.1 acyl-CoA dehydrogenase [Bacilli bacterium VT-13-104]PZD87299.1 acyl-CoA dehydrogenase [Bacilli bacterium]MCR1835435.1 acyl-CoA dehydrogenase [Oceanobacillus caeni]PZD88773.1 acyl-CoA dehydrogenase [Bacilli bacterium]PZD91627.1 acyl-CoA dehydrogenase [Bacilli bacterium]
MELRFTEEQEMICKMVRGFTEKEVAKEIGRMETEDRFPKEIVEKMGKLGLMGISIPEKYGGSGMDFTSYIIAIHELSKVSPVLGVILSVHSSVGTNPILYFGTDEQKRHYIPKLASGKYLGAFALTEPGSGSDVKSLKTTAKDNGDHFVLNGSKVFITNGGEADTYITFARTEKDEISAFIVEKDANGLQIGKKEKKMGLHGSNTVQLSFDNCIVPKKQLLGKLGEGFKIAMSNLNVGRIGIGAQSLGIAEGALQHAIDYAKERQQFGKPIAANQGISFKLADMATEVEAAKLLVYHAASLVDRGQNCAKEASMAKMYASNTAMRLAIEAVQIFGGNGYTEDFPIERYFRDAKVTQIYEGTNEIQHIVIANQLLNN